MIFRIAAIVKKAMRRGASLRLLIPILFALGVGANRAEAQFYPGQLFNVGNSPVAIATGDLNSDGKMDCVVCNSSDNTISVFFGNGDGTFQPPAVYAVNANPEAVVIGDLNGDNKPDIVVANYGAARVSVFLNSGGGAFPATASEYFVGNGPNSVALGDFNGDGKLDIVTANYSDTTLSVLINRGTGAFKPQTVLTVPSSPYVVRVSDMNSDNKQDIVYSYYYGVGILYGNGNGTFQAPITAITNDYAITFPLPMSTAMASRTLSRTGREVLLSALPSTTATGHFRRNRLIM